MSVSPPVMCLLAALAFIGCDNDDAPVRCGSGTVLIDGECQVAPTCGPGTVLMGGQCVVASVTDAGPPPPPPPPGTDAGTPPPPPPMTDAGGGWTLDPPGSTPPPDGCDVASGECDEWEAGLLALMGPARGCGTALTIDPGVQRVAERHAAHQSTMDTLTSSSPDGDLFLQVRNEGVTYMYAGALFSVSRDGASDVFDRWAAGADTAAYLSQCWTRAGIAIHTSETGASYVSVLLVR